MAHDAVLRCWPSPTTQHYLEVLVRRPCGLTQKENGLNLMTTTSSFGPFRQRDNARKGEQKRRFPAQERKTSRNAVTRGLLWLARSSARVEFPQGTSRFLRLVVY